MTEASTTSPAESKSGADLPVNLIIEYSSSSDKQYRPRLVSYLRHIEPKAVVVPPHDIKGLLFVNAPSSDKLVETLWSDEIMTRYLGTIFRVQYVEDSVGAAVGKFDLTDKVVRLMVSPASAAKAIVAQIPSSVRLHLKQFSHLLWIMPVLMGGTTKYFCSLTTADLYRLTRGALLNKPAPVQLAAGLLTASSPDEKDAESSGTRRSDKPAKQDSVSAGAVKGIGGADSPAAPTAAPTAVAPAATASETKASSSASVVGHGGQQPIKLRPGVNQSKKGEVWVKVRPALNRRARNRQAKDERKLQRKLGLEVSSWQERKDASAPASAASETKDTGAFASEDASDSKLAEVKAADAKGRSKGSDASSTVKSGATSVADLQSDLCRAYWKIRETFEHPQDTKFPLVLTEGMRAVDVGAAPGGWSYYLAGRGVRVLAIDPADLRIPAHTNIRHVPKLIEDALDDIKQFGALDVVVCDMNIDARRGARLLLSISHLMRKDGILVFTLKSVIKNSAKGIGEDAAFLLSAVFDDAHITQLFSNGNEFTMMARRNGNAPPTPKELEALEAKMNQRALERKEFGLKRKQDLSGTVAYERKARKKEKRKQEREKELAEMEKRLLAETAGSKPDRTQAADECAVASAAATVSVTEGAGEVKKS